MDFHRVVGSDVDSVVASRITFSNNDLASADLDPE